MGAFERLHPHVRHAIVHDLGWKALRPVQEGTIDAVLDGCNAVVLAPTAGGKTEAAMFPVLSRILSEQPEGVAALYICPIRALLNNQEERLRGLTRMVGLDVFKWHGDVGDGAKERFRKSPTQVLMTTPESLEVMLVSARTDCEVLFRGLGVVVIDEVHAFAGDDRGAHLMAIVERLVGVCGRDVQRVGLSATVGNPGVIGEWLRGSSGREFRLVDPPKAAVRRDLRVEYCEDELGVASTIVAKARGKKSLVFVESRSKAEKVALALGGRGVDVFIHHSAVSRADRALAEERFTRGENTAIVCTSTMELGIDVGDLDQVIQVGAPNSVASFLQRVGRTGRRANTVANATVVCQTAEELLQAVAVLFLAESGWVEDVRPDHEAVFVLAHQVMALVLQQGGISRHRIWGWVGAAFPFSGIGRERVGGLVDTMVEREILYEADGVLSLGRRGESLFGKKNFFELYAVFTAQPMLRVMAGQTEVGTVQAQFVMMQDNTQGPLCFRLAGRAWMVVEVDWAKGVVRVRAADKGKVPSWLGVPGVLSHELCGAVKKVCAGEVEGGRWLSKTAKRELEAVQIAYEGVVGPGGQAVEDQETEVVWHTFAGGAINRLLAAGLMLESGKKWVAGNLSVRCKEEGMSGAIARGHVEKLAEVDWESLAKGVAKGLTRGTWTKFQPCLPQSEESKLLVNRLLDVKGTRRWITSSENG